MDRHLNVFLPYERVPHREDYLTRAAMVVMRALPLARDALLARIGAHPSARLPEPEADMHTRHVGKPPVVGEGDSPSMRQLISVFLSPDEGLDLSTAEIEERVREQRLDGVLRFGDELVVVIESKIVGEMPSDQAKLLRLRGVEVDDSKVIGLGWHELLEDWSGACSLACTPPSALDAPPATSVDVVTARSLWTRCCADPLNLPVPITHPGSSSALLSAVEISRPGMTQ